MLQSAQDWGQESCTVPASRSLISILEAKLPSFWNGSEKRTSISLSVKQTYSSASAVLILSHHLHRGRAVHTQGSGLPAAALPVVMGVSTNSHPR